MNLFKKWDFWYWLIVVVFTVIEYVVNLSEPFGGLIVITILIPAIFIYVIVLKIFLQIIVGGILKRRKNKRIVP